MSSTEFSNVCPANSLSHPAPLSLLTTPHVSHILLLLDSKVLLQRVSGGYIFPCVLKTDLPRYPLDKADAPEVLLFSRDYFNTSHLHIIRVLPQPGSSSPPAWACFAQISHLEDERRFAEMTRERDDFILADLEQLSSLQVEETAYKGELKSHACKMLRYEQNIEDYPKNFPPWYRVGFCHRVREWILTNLPEEWDELGYEIEMAVARTWGLGCTMFVVDVREYEKQLYFKACPTRKIDSGGETEYDQAMKTGLAGGYFGKEVEITKLINDKANSLIPKLVACDNENGWMLSEDGGATLREMPVTETDINTLLDRLVRFQKETIGEVESFRRKGLKDRSFSALVKNLRDVVEDDVVDGLGELEEYYEDVQEMCKNLEEASPMSEIVVHGDLNAGNVVVKKCGDVVEMSIIDWSDASIAHPLVEMNGMEGRKLRRKYAEKLGIQYWMGRDAMILTRLDELILQIRLWETWKIDEYDVKDENLERMLDDILDSLSKRRRNELEQ